MWGRLTPVFGAAMMVSCGAAAEPAAANGHAVGAAIDHNHHHLRHLGHQDVVDVDDVSQQQHKVPSGDVQVVVEEVVEEEEEEGPEVDINIANVVTNFSTCCHLNLRQIANVAANVIYKREQAVSVVVSCRHHRHPAVTQS